MQNKLTDLNNHLFAALERLNDEDLTGKELQAEVARSRTIASVGKEIVNNAKVVLDAEQFKRDSMNPQLPEIFNGPQKLKAISGDKQ